MEKSEITKADIQDIINGIQNLDIEKGHISHYDGISFEEYMKDVICCLHLSSRQDRYDDLQIQIKEHNIKRVLYFEGERFKHSPKKGICRGHKKIVQFAKDQKLKKIIIAEDDFVLFGKGGNAWRYFLNNIPEDYDIFTALVYVGDVENNRIISQASGWNTLYIVHERFYDFFLSIPDDVHLDRELSKHWAEYKFMVSPMFICQQSGAWSDNRRTKQRMDYSPLLVGRKLFGQ